MPVLPGAPVGVPRATNRSPTFGWDKYDDLWVLLHILFSRVRPSRPPIVWACWLGLQVHPTHQECVSSEFRTLEPPSHTHMEHVGTWGCLKTSSTSLYWNDGHSMENSPHLQALLNTYPILLAIVEYTLSHMIYFRIQWNCSVFFFKISFFGWFWWVKAVNSFNPWFSAKLELWGSSPVGSEDGSAAREV